MNDTTLPEAYIEVDSTSPAKKGVSPYFYTSYTILGFIFIIAIALLIHYFYKIYPSVRPKFNEPNDF